MKDVLVSKAERRGELLWRVQNYYLFGLGVAFMILGLSLDENPQVSGTLGASGAFATFIGLYLATRK